MIKNEKSKYGQPLYILFPGEFHATSENCIMASITGATVLVCLYDLERKIAGMCHFIVPGTISSSGIIADDIASFGIQNMELLIGEIVKIGGNRRSLKAKLFGAAFIKESISLMGGIQESNIRFLHEYFLLEKIKVVKEDLGGDKRRKIYFFPHTGLALRRFQQRNKDSSEFRVMEKEYIDNIFANNRNTGRVIYF